ncbi:Cytochrome P450 [Mycena sanguinolenta]|uniref:Cytochrome P450 n=1 Tax=Mycena sanguinolenta TaxID=230812 RepID=A0A8H6YSI6_9AGAR|nr:Cytochrome P450 [Mycena sanguinolenta]
MTTNMVSVHNILVEQTEPTRQSSRAELPSNRKSTLCRIASATRLRVSPHISTPSSNCTTASAHVPTHSGTYLPIHTLPIELLAEIFRLTLEEEDAHIVATYRISQICSDWRNIACGSPQLWTGPLCVDLGSEKISGREDIYADGLEAWLARSVPLSVPVSLRLELDRTKCNPRILEVVLKEAPRFRSLRCTNAPLSLISRLVECRLDSLEELDLGFVESDSSAAEVPAFTMVPRLRKSSIPIRSKEPHVLIPWAQLTDVTLACDSIDIVLDILAQCATLTYAALYTSGWYTYPATTQLARAPLALSQLRTLTLDFGRSQHMMRFLSAVSAPALETLHLNFLEMQDDRMQSAGPLTAFLMQSPSITRLEIQCGSRAPTSHEFIDAFGCTVQLTHLKLAYPCEHSFDDTLLEALSCKDGVAPLVPNLHNLVLHRIMDRDGFAIEALERMFVSRWQQANAEISSRSGLHDVARWSHVELCRSLRGTFLHSLQRKGLPVELTD